VNDSHCGISGASLAANEQVQQQRQCKLMKSKVQQSALYD
jgi:hypothetical protein